VPDRILITTEDYDKLQGLIDGRRYVASEHPNLENLQKELERAEVVAPEEMPAGVVTMNSRVQLRDLDSGEVKVYTLVFPSQVRGENAISILAPIGTAILGYSEGDIIEWPVPKGIRRLQVLGVTTHRQAA
jgi:regulator of nucleoside diphosphate kinase